jgi:hypothetical protein
MRNLSTGYAEAFRQAGVFSQKSLVRMQDQKLLTEIASAYFDGIKTTNKRTLDAVWCAPAFVESDNWMSCSCLD